MLWFVLFIKNHLLICLLLVLSAQAVFMQWQSFMKLAINCLNNSKFINKIKKAIRNGMAKHAKSKKQC